MTGVDRLNELFDVHYQELVHWCQRRLAGRNDEAEDVVQEAYLRCVRNWNTELRSRDREVAYLYRATRWALVDLLRRRQRADVRTTAYDLLPDRRECFTWQRLVFDEAIERLPRRQRLVCRAMQAGVCMSKLASDMALTSAAIAVHRCRAKQALEEALA